MAYAIESNIPTGKPVSRTLQEQQTSHRWYVTHVFDTQVGTTALSLNKLIEDNNGVKVFGKESKFKRHPNRSHIEITNNHASQTLYLARYSAVSSSVYTFYLSASGGYVKEPMTTEDDIFIIGSGSSTACTVTELG